MRAGCANWKLRVAWCFLLVLALLSPVHLRAANEPASGIRSGAGGIVMWNPITRDCRKLSEIRKELQSGNRFVTEKVAELQRTADKLLIRPLRSVMDKPFLPPSGDKHDYFSLATYYWPDTHSTNGLPYVSRDGKTNPEGKDYDNTSLGRMCEAVHTLSFAYCLTGKENYAVRAVEQIRAWYLDEETRMHPSLKYAQVIKGIQTNSPFGIIDTRPMLKVVDAVTLLRESAAWRTEDNVKLQGWFCSYLDWLITSEQGCRAAEYDNNQGTWYDVQTVRYALFVGKNTKAREIVEAAKSRRIAKQIEPDGRQPRELSRSKSFTYSVSNLGAMIRLAALGEQLGVNLWDYRSPDGRSIRRAVNYLAPFVDPVKVWPFKQIEKVDRKEMLKPLLEEAALHSNPVVKPQNASNVQAGSRARAADNGSPPSTSAARGL